MTTASDRPVLAPSPPLSKAWLPASFATGLATSAACYAAAGPTLQFPIGGVLFAAVLVPPLSLIATRAIDAILIAASVALGIAVIWVFTIHAWLPSTIVLLAFTAALSATAQALVRLRINAIIASAIVTLGALGWLTWPVWASSLLVGQRVHWLVTLHPLFAINGACRDLGIWTEQRVAYHLTNLGQDVPYELPTSVAPSTALHAGWAVAALLLVTAIDVRRRKRRQPRMATNARE
jgi:hypothetical protein